MQGLGLGGLGAVLCVNLSTVDDANKKKGVPLSLCMRVLFNICNIAALSPGRPG